MTANDIAPVTRTRELSNSLEVGTAVVSFIVTGEETNGSFPYWKSRKDRATSRPITYTSLKTRRCM